MDVKALKFPEENPNRKSLRKIQTLFKATKMNYQFLKALIYDSLYQPIITSNLLKKKKIQRLYLHNQILITYLRIKKRHHKMDERAFSILDFVGTHTIRF